jgi:hypothetical protein
LFRGVNAEIEVVPAMRFDDLKRGLDAVKYGKTTQLFRLPARSIGKPLGVSEAHCPG